MPPSFDAVIVGSGIAGGGLATVLARAGKSVLLLEKSTVYRDQVRGEPPSWSGPRCCHPRSSPMRSGRAFAPCKGIGTRSRPGKTARPRCGADRGPATYGLEITSDGLAPS